MVFTTLYWMADGLLSSIFVWVNALSSIKWSEHDEVQ